MNVKGRYSFDLILKHSNGLAITSRSNHKDVYGQAKRSLSFLGAVIDEIAKEPKSHFRNVRMALATRFFNHLFSQIILTERGLYLDAANSSRSATEVMSFYWLVCIEPASSELYDAKMSPRPVEVRRKLEALNIDVTELRDIYGHQSTVSHVGNFYDNLQIKWLEAKNREVMVGGSANPEVQRASFNAITASLLLFLRYDPNYEVLENMGA